MNGVTKKIFIAFLFIFITSYTNAQQDSMSIRTESTGWIIISDAVLFVPATVVIIMNHECGHYVMASIFGAQDVRLGLHKNNAIGWTQWNNDLGRFGNSFAYLGGVLFSRGLAEGSDCMVRHINLSSWGQRFFSMTFIFGRFDFARYVLIDALMNLSGKRGSDINDFVTQVAGHNDVSRVMTYTALFAIATVDLIFDWNRVVMYWKILEGESYANKSIGSHARISIRPYFNYGSIGLSTGVEW